MYTAADSFYSVLLEAKLTTRDLPVGDEGNEVKFADGVFKVVVEHQRAENKIPPTYPL